MSEEHDSGERPGAYVFVSRRRRRRAMRVPLDEVPRRSVVSEEPSLSPEVPFAPGEPPEGEGRPTWPERVAGESEPEPGVVQDAARSASGELEGALPSIEVSLDVEESSEWSDSSEREALVGEPSSGEEDRASLNTVEEKLPEPASAPTSPGGAPSEPSSSGVGAEARQQWAVDDLEDSGEEAEPIELEDVDALRPAPPPPPEPPARPSGPTPPPAPSAPRPRKAWFEEYFDDDYLRTVPPMPQRAVERQCDFLVAALGLTPGCTVLDVGCGLGLQAIELARRGVHVVAMDVSLAMLARAAEEAQEAGLHLNLLHADMREMDFERTFDAVLCLGTTFGYFDDETNARVLGRFHRALKPGGRLMLDVVNRDHVLASQPNLIWFEGDGCVCMEETDFNFLTSRLVVKRTLMFDDGQQRLVFSSVRLYSLHELGHLMHGQGFRVTSVSGMEATPGVFLGAVSPRIMMVAHRPEAGRFPQSSSTASMEAVPAASADEDESAPPTIPGDASPAEMSSSEDED